MKSVTKAKPNAWQVHVKATMNLKANKGKTLREILPLAKKTYKK